MRSRYFPFLTSTTIPPGRQVGSSEANATPGHEYADSYPTGAPGGSFSKNHDPAAIGGWIAGPQKPLLIVAGLVHVVPHLMLKRSQTARA